MATKPDWIVPGVEVLLYDDGHFGYANVRVRKVLKVSTQSFTVVDQSGTKEPRFRFAGEGGCWRTPDNAYGADRFAVAYGSATADKVLAEVRKAVLLSQAQSVVAMWNRLDSPENLAKAIEALQALQRSRESK
jgi:hypothetical protein